MSTRKKTGSRKRRGTRSQYASASAECTSVIIGAPFTIQQSTSGNGALGTLETPVSLGGTSFVGLDCYTIGGRLVQFADLFAQYMILDGEVEYIPQSTSSGVFSAAAGASTTPSYSERNVAIGIISDPAYNPASDLGIIQAGGCFYRTSDRWKFRFPRSVCGKWLWTSTTVTYGTPPTSVDNRMVMFGNLCARFTEPSVTNTTEYGELVFRMKVRFRGVATVASPVGANASPPSDGNACDRPVGLGAVDLDEKEVDGPSKLASRTPGKGITACCLQVSDACRRQEKMELGSVSSGNRVSCDSIHDRKPRFLDPISKQSH